MNKNTNSENNESSSPDQENILSLLKKMQGQLNSIEGKIKILLQPSKEKSFKPRHSSRPHHENIQIKRPSERKHKEKKEEVSSERKFYHGSPFGIKKDGGKSNFRKKKKSFVKKQNNIKT